MAISLERRRWHPDSRMHRTLKTLLLLLLIAALPLQGAAAAMRLSCGPAHHHQPAQLASATGAPHHDAAAAHFDSDHSAFDATASAEQAPAAQVGHAHSSCSACAACCVGAAAPPSASIPTAPLEGSEFIAVAPAPLLAGFIPASLERPPRTVFA